MALDDSVELSVRGEQLELLTTLDSERRPRRKALEASRPARTEKLHGQFFTPAGVAQTLVRWAVEAPGDRLLDPACGDGQFLAAHAHISGCEVDPRHAVTARARAPHAHVHVCDFFEWAESTNDRFEAVVGNPPFIRYQGFTGEVRERALRQSLRFGAKLPALTSSWAPFVAASALLVKPGGRIAFVVPAEIGHAAYAVPLVEGLCASFETVVIVAVREKIFPSLSEDAWLLFASGKGGSTGHIRFVAVDDFIVGSAVPRSGQLVSIAKLRAVRGRLRRWLLSPLVRETYEHFEEVNGAIRLGDVASVGIGYVSGANDFFHLRPSQARKAGIPSRLLVPAVRRGASLPLRSTLRSRDVEEWIANDDPVLLLRLDRKLRELPTSVRRYLDSPAGRIARTAYKCRVREPWYSVPDVTVPDGFLTYMSGESVQVIGNAARCVGTNSVHVVHMKDGCSFRRTQSRFESVLTQLSCELEGHPLGGGMLKVEPREAQRLLLSPEPSGQLSSAEATLRSGIEAMRSWRGYG